MLFSSPVFFAFFVIYLVLHLAVPVRHRLTLIIIGSTIFYGYWNIYYVWIPHILMLIAFLGVLWMTRTAANQSRRSRMIAVIVLLLLPLVGVKYANFFYHEVLGPPLGLTGTIYSPPLPLGISFITFTLIAYVVEVARRRFVVEHDLGILAGLVLFFPHLIAGPILRPSDLLPQLHHPTSAFRNLRRRMIIGITIFTVGLFKKVVIADPVAASVDSAFRVSAGLTAPEYLLGIYGFSVQIYCDFSGYTDMALAVALMLGIRLPTNFNMPYRATSIIDFWRRWHITLSTWLRDYLYIPLGGNRLGHTRQVVNLLITMALGGLWHGANWTFVVWGVMHGSGIAIAHGARWCGLGAVIDRVPRWLLLVLTFHFVTVAWVFFRAPSLQIALDVLSGPFVAPAGDLAAFVRRNAFPLTLMAGFAALHGWDNHRQIRRFLKRIPGTVLWPLLALAWVLAMTVSAGSSQKFIYFDF